MTYGIFWLLFSVAAGIFASNRGRSGIGWCLLSLLISPLLGLIFVAVMKDLSQPASQSTQPSATTHIKCPACAEFVLPEARVCKHCATTLVPTDNHLQNQQQMVKLAEADATTKKIMGVVLIVALFIVAVVLSGCGS